MVAKNKKIKVVLVEDHVSVRASYRQVLEDTSCFKIVGEAGNGKELFNILPDISPDIVLLDIEMPQMNGYEALLKLNRQFPKIKVVILSAHYSNVYVNEFLSRGASAYLYKNCMIEDIMQVMKSVYADDYHKSESLSNSVVLDESQNSIISEKFGQICLTEREVQVLKLICEGKPIKQMGDILNIDINTVNYHKKNIYRKTRLNSIGPLVQYAIKNGIINIE